MQVPLLAECLDDIVPLAEFMLNIANQELDKSVKGFDMETQKKFKTYSWPGNIRELRTIVKRAVLLAKDDWITAEDVGLLSNERLKEYTLKNERTERNNIVKELEATNNNRFSDELYTFHNFILHKHFFCYCYIFDCKCFEYSMFNGIILALNINMMI